MPGLLKLSRGVLDLQAENDFGDRNAGERKHAVFAGIGGSFPGYVPIMTLKVFGKDIGIEKSFFHPSERDGGMGRAASFFVGQLDDFIQQDRVGRTAEQAEPLLKDRRPGPARSCLRGPMLIEPRLEFSQLLRRQRVDGAFDFLECIQVH